VIKAGDGAALSRIERTYTEAFPPAERRDFALVAELLREEPRFTLCSLLYEDRYIGFISFWRFEAFAYIEHFAIDASERNKGWGGIVLRQFTRKIHPVVLETEPPSDKISRRRIGFYERAGFVLSPHPYLQPPYRRGEAAVPLRLMSYGEIDAGRDFGQIRQTLYRHVYRTDDTA
jgi:ribosomal protein S18 acetylase RimI-like enzyme